MSKTSQSELEKEAKTRLDPEQLYLDAQKEIAFLEFTLKNEKAIENELNKTIESHAEEIEKLIGIIGEANKILDELLTVGPSGVRIFPTPQKLERLRSVLMLEKSKNGEKQP